MVENQILVVGRAYPENSSSLQFPMTNPAVPAHIWLTCYKGESLVRKGQEIERCVKMPFVNEVTNDIVQTIVSFLLIE